MDIDQVNEGLMEIGLRLSCVGLSYTLSRQTAARPWLASARRLADDEYMGGELGLTPGEALINLALAFELTDHSQRLGAALAEAGACRREAPNRASLQPQGDEL